MNREEKEQSRWVSQRRTLESLAGIRGAAKIVLLKIHSLGRCFMRQETLAAETGVHRVTICRALARLESLGIIRGERRGQGESSSWWVDWEGVENYIQPSLFGSVANERTQGEERQTATSRSNKTLHQEVAVCTTPILIKTPNRHLSLTPTSAAPREVAEQVAFDLVRRWYDRKDVPAPASERREREAALVMVRIDRHGENVVRQAIEEMSLEREYLSGSEWQLDRSIKRIKSRRKGPAVRVEKRETDESDVAWDRLTGEERALWIKAAKEQHPVLKDKDETNPFVLSLAASLFAANSLPAPASSSR